MILRGVKKLSNVDHDVKDTFIEHGSLEARMRTTGFAAYPV